MKRFIAILLVLVMALSIVACSKEDKPVAESEKPDTPVDTPKEEPVESTPPEDEKVEESADETFPDRNISIVIPFKPGGGNDISIRIIAPEAEKIFGEKIIVENKDGGGAVIGQTYATSAAPDGYTLLATTNSYVTNVITVDTSYDLDSIIPVLQFGTDAEVLVVNKNLGVETLDEFLEYAKNEAVTISTSGAGTSHHIASLVLAKDADLKFEYLHPDGGSQAMVQVLGGHSDATMVTVSMANSGQVDLDKLTILGVATEERVESLPDVPTFKEKGIDLVYGAWRGLSVPKGTPENVVKLLHDGFKQALETEEVKNQFETQNYELAYLSSEDFKKVIDDTYEYIMSIKDLMEE